MATQDGASSSRSIRQAWVALAVSLSDDLAALREPLAWPACAAWLACVVLAACLGPDRGGSAVSPESFRAAMQALSLGAALMGALAAGYCARLLAAPRSAAQPLAWSVLGSLPAWLLVLRAGLLPASGPTILALAAAAGCAAAGYAARARTTILPASGWLRDICVPWRRASEVHHSADEPAASPRGGPGGQHTLLQWMRRVVKDDGSEELHGAISLSFAAGQSRAAGHLPFVPPFNNPSEFTCTVEPAELARVASCTVFPYGARIELKRSRESVAETTVRMHFVVQSKAPIAAERPA